MNFVDDVFIRGVVSSNNGFNVSCLRLLLFLYFFGYLGYCCIDGKSLFDIGWIE